MTPEELKKLLNEIPKGGQSPAGAPQSTVSNTPQYTPASQSEQNMADVYKTINSLQPGGSSPAGAPQSSAIPSGPQYTSISPQEQARIDTLNAIRGATSIGQSPAGASQSSISSPYTPVTFAPQKEKVFTSGDAAGAVKNANLQGLNLENSLVGLTESQALQKINDLKSKLQSSVSQNTSYSFNPSTIAGADKQLANLQFKLDENNNNPWTNQSDKKTNAQAITSSYATELAKLFDNQDQFNAALQTPQFQNTLQKFTSLGGNVADIQSKINPTGLPPGWDAQTYANFKAANPNLEPTPQDTIRMQSTGANIQTIDQYLGQISTPAEKKAFETLIPEKTVYQQQIALEQSIPSQYYNMYFGTPEKLGIIAQQRSQAEETVKLLEQKEQFAKDDAKAQADIQVAKNKAAMDVELAKIEENRLNAKNYMTGMLAKLGALKTTGAAPGALATIEERYQKQATQTRTDYNIANSELEQRLNKFINNTTLDTSEKILKVKADLSLSEEKILQKAFELQNTANRNVLDKVQTYAQEYRTLREKYTEQAKADAEKYAKEFAKNASKFNAETFSQFLSRKETQTQSSLIPSAQLPAFLQSVISNKTVSDNLKSVISGNLQLSDLTPSDRTDVVNELTKLGLSKDQIGAQSVPDVGSLLSEAKSKIDNSNYTGKQLEEYTKLIKQKFLQAYPDKNASWNAYFND